MIEKHFEGTQEFSIDIHGGGADLLFPHHENEASQSRCASGHALSKYWMHNGFVQIDGEKMSKSLGNSCFLKDALALYDGEVLRYYLNSVHYRNDFNFSKEALETSKKRLDKLYRLKKRVIGGKASLANKAFEKSLKDAMGDDLNISISLALIDEMIAISNDSLDETPKNKSLKKEILANMILIDRLLGFGGKEPFSYFQIGVDEALKEKIELLIIERSEAKKAKEFGRSDAIRDEITALGIAIMDTSEGTLWERV
jgi:cysteinyl-tRNA synthetase